MQCESIISHCSAVNIFQSLICVQSSYTITLVKVFQCHVRLKNLLQATATCRVDDSHGAYINANMTEQPLKKV